MADVSELLIEVKNVNATISDIDKVGQKLKQTQKEAIALGKTIFASWSFSKLMQGAKAFGEAWKDTLNTFRNFSAVFGEFNAEAINGAKELENAFQMTEKGAKKLLSTIASRVSFGLNDKELAKVSTGIAKLSHDIAAFYGTDFNQVSLKLTNSLSGMTRGLREFGISIDTSSPKFQRMVQDMMLSAGVTKEAAKQLVIYNEILRQGKKFEGAFDKATKTLANAIDNVANELKDGAFAKAGEVLSGIFVPILEKVNEILKMPWVQEIMGIVTALGLVLAAVIAIRTAMAGLTSMLKAGAAIGGIEGLIANLLITIGGAIKGIVVGLGKLILGAITAVVAFIAGLPTAVIAAIIAVLAGAATLLVNRLTTGEWFNFSGMVDSVVGWFDRLAQKIINLFSGRGWKTNDEWIHELKAKLIKSIKEIADLIKSTNEDFNEWRDSLGKLEDQASLEKDFDKAKKKVDQSAALFVQLSNELDELYKKFQAAGSLSEQEKILEELKKKEIQRNQALQTYKQAWANMVDADKKLEEYLKKIDQNKFLDFTWYQDIVRKIKDGLGQTLPRDKVRDIEDRINEFKKTFTHMTPEEQKEAYKQLGRMQLEKFQAEMAMINKEREAIQKTQQIIQDYLKKAMEWKPQGAEGIEAGTMEGYKFMTSGYSSLASLGPVLQNTQTQQADLQKRANDIASQTQKSVDEIKEKINNLSNRNAGVSIAVVN